jgi:hypothetical protein
LLTIRARRYGKKSNALSSFLPNEGSGYVEFRQQVHDKPQVHPASLQCRRYRLLGLRVVLLQPGFNQPRQGFPEGAESIIFSVAHRYRPFG